MAEKIFAERKKCMPNGTLSTQKDYAREDFHWNKARCPKQNLWKRKGMTLLKKGQTSPVTRSARMPEY